MALNETRQTVREQHEYRRNNVFKSSLYHAGPRDSLGPGKLARFMARRVVSFEGPAYLLSDISISDTLMVNSGSLSAAIDSAPDQHLSCGAR